MTPQRPVYHITRDGAFGAIVPVDDIPVLTMKGLLA